MAVRSPVGVVGKTTRFGYGTLPPESMSTPWRDMQVSVNFVVYSPYAGTLASGSEDGTFLLWEVTPAMHAIDINPDGVINTQDLEWVATHIYGTPDQDAADVNRDGIVNIFDLVLV